MRLSRRAMARAGMDVVLSNSRGPETLRQLTADLGPRARAATPAEAAAAGDWTVVAVPFRGVPHLPADALAGKIVIVLKEFGDEYDFTFATSAEHAQPGGRLLQGGSDHVGLARGLQWLSHSTRYRPSLTAVALLAVALAPLSGGMTAPDGTSRSTGRLPR